MNFQLLRQQDGLWQYAAPEQALVAQSAEELLGWDLKSFDQWVYDSKNWSMYTRERQRLIAMRDELVLHSTRQLQAGEPLTQCLAMHCINNWRLVRNSKSIPSDLLVALSAACRTAQTLALRSKIPVKLRMRTHQLSVFSRAFIPQPLENSAFSSSTL